MEQLNLKGQTKTEQAIEFLQRHEPPEGYFAGQSGGKDSCVTEHLLKMADVKYQSYYSNTTIDPPEIIKHIKKNYPQTIFLRPKKDFYSLVAEIGYPTKVRRWCCDRIKHSSANHIPLSHRVLGIRAEESPRRRKYGYIQKSTRPVGQLFYHPIFEWLEWEVWEFIERHNLPYCLLYDEGFARLGCVLCPFICHPDKKKLDLHKNRWPKMYKAFERAMYKFWERKEFHRQSITGRAKLFDEFLDNWYRGK